MDELLTQALNAILEESPILAAFLIYWYRNERHQNRVVAEISERVESIERLFLDFNGSFLKLKNDMNPSNEHEQ